MSVTSSLRPFLAGCAVTALVLGAAWWFCGRSAPVATDDGGKVRAPAATDSTPDVGVASTIRTVVVRVLDAEDDRAIAGAHVSVRRGGDESPQEDVKGDADASGVARIDIPAGDDAFELLVSAAGHVHLRETPDDAADPKTGHVVRLDRAGRVHGVVRTADGRPVDGVAVRAEISGHDTWADDDEEAVTAGGGAYEIDGIEIGADFSVSVSDAGRIAARHGLVATTGDEVVTADLVLAAAASLRVRALWPDGLPVVGATVEVQPSGDTAETDDAGRAAVDVLPAGRHQVVVRRSGFADAETVVDLAPGESRELDLRPVPNAVIAGVVVDDAGFPAGGASIALDGSSGPLSRARADGSFRIACPDEDPHDLFVTHEGLCDTTVSAVTAPSEELRIVVPRRPKIRCRLVPPAGAAAPAHVAAWWDSRIASATLDGDVLTIEVSPGRGRASFQAQGCIVVERDVDAAPGQAIDWGDVRLAAAPKLKGRVLDANGRPIDAFVYAKVGGAQVPLTSTDKRGGFEFDGLPPGVAELRAEAKGFVNRTVHYAFAAGAEPAVILLQRGGCVRGVVRDADGAPAVGAVYVAFTDADDPDNKERQAFPNIEADGSFEVNLLPGRYRALTTLDGRQGATTVDISDGELCDVKITIPR